MTSFTEEEQAELARLTNKKIRINYEETAAWYEKSYAPHRKWIYIGLCVVWVIFIASFWVSLSTWYGGVFFIFSCVAALGLSLTAWVVGISYRDCKRWLERNT